MQPLRKNKDRDYIAEGFSSQEEMDRFLPVLDRIKKVQQEQEQWCELASAELAGTTPDTPFADIDGEPFAGE